MGDVVSQNGMRADLEELPDVLPRSTFPWCHERAPAAGCSGTNTAHPIQIPARAVPVTVEKNGIDAGRGRMSRRHSISSVLKLLHLRAVERHIHLQGAAEQACVVESPCRFRPGSAASPESVIEFGPLTAAIEMACGWRSTNLAASLREIPTANIAPCPAVRCCRRLRWKVTRTASSSDKRARNVGRCHFAGAMAENCRRFDAPRPPQRRSPTCSAKIAGCPKWVSLDLRSSSRRR